MVDKFRLIVMKDTQNNMELTKTIENNYSVHLVGTFLWRISFSKGEISIFNFIGGIFTEFTEFYQGIT